jgi:hypothetical protein
MRIRSVLVLFSFFSALAATACDDYSGALPTLPSDDAAAPVGDASAQGDGGDGGARDAATDAATDAPAADAVVEGSDGSPDVISDAQGDGEAASPEAALADDASGDGPSGD